MKILTNFRRCEGLARHAEPVLLHSKYCNPLKERLLPDKKGKFLNPKNVLTEK
jgi:hypothetical protein